MKIRIIIIAFLILSFSLINCNDRQKNSDKKGITLILKETSFLGKNQTKNQTSLDSLYDKLIQQPNDSINRNLLFKIGDICFYNNKFETYLKIIKRVNHLSQIDNDTMHIAKSLQFIGDYFDQKKELDSAYYYYYKSEKVYNLIKDTLKISKNKIKKAAILFDNGNFNESENEIIKVLKLLEKKQDKELILECYNLLALNLKETNDYSKSLKYFSLAVKQLDKLDKSKKDDIRFYGANCYNNIGNVYLKIRKYKKAQEYYLKALSVTNLKKINPSIYAMVLSNLAYAKLKNDDSKGVKEMLFNSYLIRKDMNNKLGIISSKCKIGEYYLYKKDTVKAITYIHSYYILSKKIKRGPDILNSLKLLTEIDTKNKNFYANEYFRVNDSLQQVERATRNKFARIEFETGQIEEENSVLIKKNTYIIVGALIVLFVAGIFFILYRLKTKTKELKHIQDQQIKNEEIYQLLLKQQYISEESRKEERNRMAKELHDGVVNSIFTTRFNLMQLESYQTNKKSELVKELEKTETEIRRVSHELKENLDFNDNGIVDMISNLVASQKNQWNTKFDCIIDKFINWNQIESEVKMNSYRVIQEALQNVNKYAKAERCIVMLLKTSDKTTIRIWDNGVGFDTSKTKKGIGLKNIEERVKAMSGSLKLTSTPNEGTKIEIIF